MKTEIVSEDAFALSKGVELAYRVKGAFAPTENKLTITGLESKSDEEISEMLLEEQTAINRAMKFRKGVRVKKTRIIEGEVI